MLERSRPIARRMLVASTIAFLAQLLAAQFRLLEPVTAFYFGLVVVVVMALSAAAWLGSLYLQRGG